VCYIACTIAIYLISIKKFVLATCTSLVEMMPFLDFKIMMNYQQARMKSWLNNELNKPFIHVNILYLVVMLIYVDVLCTVVTLFKVRVL
jgi:hypothetical protein